ncbi:oligosaccharide flippase family protein [Flavobacterium urumqiense]|uniref:Membrane protein involved in the export of O-antigen and teichoic acid n=1 Tax=Flavobacterium urumqiense TaxID=935224 RepID=A0A1H5S786_9FLAO|nr:oligosaccharide flippase family protein [Flavobacterium urumqiense]SEF46264.1 Membrane protein involved in the export of O-antigen and teichoic acid [Flavobacterium urumqiense]
MNLPSIPKKLSSDHVFMLTMLVVNAGNYIYNLLLGRILGPTEFSDAAILITFLLILSFLGMTFQIVAAKYSVLFENQKLQLFIVTITKIAVLVGVVFGAIIMIFNSQLQTLFHTKTATMFLIFAIGIPLYFLMSVNRGLYQGKNDLKKMSVTYITEMLSRLFLTLALVLLVPSLPTSVAVAAGISISLIFGLFPFQKSIVVKTNISFTNEVLDTKSIIIFFALTAFYELTQIIINNSDIILVKHYFNNKEAGLYASLALIGRVVYFVAWMFVMLLLPKVILLKKEGKNTLPILMKYISYITVLSIGIVLFTYLFPNFVVKVMFGEKYISIAFLLWKYALATSVFAIANIFAYYFLSINKYIPVVISAVLGITQIALIVLFHNSLEQVVEMQVIAMVVLLFFQLCFFFYHNKKNVRLN